MRFLSISFYLAAVLRTGDACGLVSLKTLVCYEEPSALT